MILFLVWTRVSISRPWSGWTVILLSLAAIWWRKSKFRDNATRYYRPFKKKMDWKTTYISSKKRIGPKFKFFDHGPHGPTPMRCVCFSPLAVNTSHRFTKHKAVVSWKTIHGPQGISKHQTKTTAYECYRMRLWMIIEWRLMSTIIWVFLQIDRYNPAFLHGRRETQFDHLIHFICFYSRTKARISTAATAKFLSLLTWNIPTYVHSKLP